MHARLLPFRHRFRYRVFSMLLDLDELDDRTRRLRLFSRNRFNLFAFHDRDHAARDGTPVRDWVWSKLRQAGYDLHEGRILIHCFPRIFGYTFNPLTTYFCYHRSGHLRAVLYEVKNTFGEQHCYLLPVEGHEQGQPILQNCKKGFYVSPFMEMAAQYRFRLKEPGEKLSILIREETPQGETLIAAHTARRSALTDSELIKVALLYPLLTMTVMAGIHWEALKLWLKGARLHPRPQPPNEEVTAAGRASDRRRAA